MPSAGIGLSQVSLFAKVPIHSVHTGFRMSLRIGKGLRAISLLFLAPVLHHFLDALGEAGAFAQAVDENRAAFQ